MTLRLLLDALVRLVGNKRYFDELRVAIKDIELTPSQRQSLEYLINDINQAKQDSDSAKRRGRFY